MCQFLITLSQLSSSAPPLNHHHHLRTGRQHYSRFKWVVDQDRKNLFCAIIYEKLSRGVCFEILIFVIYDFFSNAYNYIT